MNFTILMEPVSECYINFIVSHVMYSDKILNDTNLERKIIILHTEFNIASCDYFHLKVFIANLCTRTPPIITILLKKSDFTCVYKIFYLASLAVAYQWIIPDPVASRELDAIGVNSLYRR